MGCFAKRETFVRCRAGGITGLGDDLMCVANPAGPSEGLATTTAGAHLVSHTYAIISCGYELVKSARSEPLSIEGKSMSA